jgi:hypothetical protein
MPRTHNVELGFISRPRASLMAFAILNTLQDEPLEYMAAALGLVLKTLTEVKHLSPQDIMTAADNMLKTTGLSDDNYIEALRSFIRDEVPN